MRFLALSHQPVRALSLRYQAVLVVLGLLMAGSYVIFDVAIESQETGAAEINISGRQRMLLQRTAYLSVALRQLPDGPQRQAFQSELTDAVDLLEARHVALLKGDDSLGLAAPTSAELRALYFGPEAQIDTDIRTYIQNIRAVLAKDRGVDITAVIGKSGWGSLSTLEGGLLDDLDRVVGQYQVEAEAKVATMRQLQGLFLGLGFATLVVTGLLVMRPAVQRVAQQMAQLRAHERELEEANSAKAEFLATMSHELRTPLNAIIGFSHIIAAKSLGENAGDRYTEYARHISDSGEHLLSMVNEILDYSAVERDGLRIDVSEMDLCDVLDAARHV